MGGANQLGQYIPKNSGAQLDTDFGGRSLVLAAKQGLTEHNEALGKAMAKLGLFGVNIYMPPVPIEAWQKRLPAMPAQIDGLVYGPGNPGDVLNWTNKTNLYKGKAAP